MPKTILCPNMKVVFYLLLSLIFIVCAIINIALNIVPNNTMIIANIVQTSKVNLHFIVPYSDQQELYEQFIRNLIQIKRPEWEIIVLVIEQSNKHTFHHSWLLNIGILESLKIGKADCIITLDVDVCLDDRVDFSWCDSPTEIESFNSNGWTKKIIQATPQHWLQIQGYTNKLTNDSSVYADLHARFQRHKLLYDDNNIRKLSLEGTVSNLQGKCWNVSNRKEIKPTASQIYHSSNSRNSMNTNREFEEDGLRTTRYLTFADEFDKWGSHWVKVQKIPNISKQDMRQIKSFYFISPIVLPKYKLIFFWNEKVACSYWKRLFQYLQGMRHSINMYYIHTPGSNKLKYLKDFKSEDVTLMMYDKQWTKATFVREPRERTLSAYLDKIVLAHYDVSHCHENTTSFGDFVELIGRCHDTHWSTQVRFHPKYYKDMIIGKMENISQFSKYLLQKIGAWNSDVQLFLSSVEMNNTRNHATNAKNRILQFYNRTLEDSIFRKFKLDYEIFGFNKKYITNS